MKITTYEFAIMSRLVELEKRYGVQPWQSSLGYDSSTGEVFITGTPAEPAAYAGFKQMLKALGASENDRVLPQSEGQEMLEALDDAIHEAPRKWVR